VPFYEDKPPRPLSPVPALLVLAVEIGLSSVTILQQSRDYALSGSSKELPIGWAAVEGLTALVCLIIGTSAIRQGWSRGESLDGAVLIVVAGVAGLILVPVIASGRIEVLTLILGAFVRGPNITF
jgi:hypothetical protein